MNILDEIVENKKKILKRLIREKPLEELKNKIEKKDFLLKKALAEDKGVHIIAEVKKSSPSAGFICGSYDPASLAEEYEKANASAVSVLTEEKYFSGSIEDLAIVAGRIKLPVLRKDFIFDEYQIFESCVYGAHAVLLIARILSLTDLKSLMKTADGLGLDSFVEIHDEDDLEKAVSAGAGIIGINNRNLATLKIDFGVSERLIGSIPAGAVAVSESGIKGAKDIKRLKAAGFRCFLVGENILKSGNAAEKILELRS